MIEGILIGLETALSLKKLPLEGFIFVGYHDGIINNFILKYT